MNKENLHENMEHIKKVTSDVLQSLPKDRAQILDVTKFAVRETAKIFSNIRQRQITEMDLIKIWNGY